MALSMQTEEMSRSTTASAKVGRVASALNAYREVEQSVHDHLYDLVL